MHIRNILKKGYSLFCYLQLYFRWYNKVVTERLKYNRKVLDMNIAAYCRVSTDKADQLNSLEAQKQFFSEYTQHYFSTFWNIRDTYATTASVTRKSIQDKTAIINISATNSR